MKAIRLVALVLMVALLAFPLTCCSDSKTGFEPAVGQEADQDDVFFNEHPNAVKASFVRKVDGDTAVFSVNPDDMEPDEETEIKVRFLGIDTPETVKEGVDVQEWGPEASEYTAERLENARSIYLEWDDAADRQDAYDRYLAWVWVDGSLLNKELVAEGLADVAYIYGDYMYVDDLETAKEAAKEDAKGIWS